MVTRHMTVLSREEAWVEASKLMEHDFDYNQAYSKNAGYPVYTNEDGWVSDLNTRLEVNLSDGTTTNIWIKQRDILAELINKSREYGYTA